MFCQKIVFIIIIIIIIIIKSFVLQSSIFQGPKQFPYNNLHLERGGSPDVEPEEVKNYEI